MSAQHELSGGADTGEQVAVETAPGAVEQPVSAPGDTPTAPEAAPAGDQDAAHHEWLRKQDWNKLPNDIRSRAELPFLQEKTRAQQQMLAQQQAIIDAFAAKTGQEPTPDVLETIKARVREGDPEAIIEMMDQVIQRQVGPVLTQNTLKAQIEDAELRVPELKDRDFQNLVGQTIQNDPAARELVSMGGHKFASLVIQQAAKNILYDRQVAQMAELKASIETAKKQAVEEHRKMVAGLPGTSTRAGTTASRDTQKAAGSMRESALQSWLAAGGSADDFK